MKGYIAIVAIVLVSATVSSATYYRGKVQSKLTESNNEDLTLISKMSAKYWDMAETEQDHALAARYNLAAETINSIGALRMKPLADAIENGLTGHGFKEELKKLLQFNTELNAKLDSRLKDLYELGKDSHDGQIFFDDVGTLTRMLERANENIGDILDKGEKPFEVHDYVNW